MAHQRNYVHLHQGEHFVAWNHEHERKAVHSEPIKQQPSGKFLNGATVNLWIFKVIHALTLPALCLLH